jgi:23S rRNA pseudouridine2605 synthase
LKEKQKSEIGLKVFKRESSSCYFEHFSYDVLRIDRVAFAGLTKKNLPRGNWRMLTDQEIINLKNV